MIVERQQCNKQYGTSITIHWHLNKQYSTHEFLCSSDVTHVRGYLYEVPLSYNLICLTRNSSYWILESACISLIHLAHNLAHLDFKLGMSHFARSYIFHISRDSSYRLFGVNDAARVERNILHRTLITACLKQPIIDVYIYCLINAQSFNLQEHSAFI